MATKQEFIGRSIIPLGSGVSRQGSYNEKGRLYDLKNARCDGQSVERRPGSTNMLPPYGEWDGHYLLDDLGWAETTISESRMLIGVDPNGKVWALSDRFPQIKFQVWSKIRSTEAAQVQFTGNGVASRYFSTETEQFFFITDERMQALRFDKRGKVEWWYGSKAYLARRGNAAAYQHQYYTGAIHSMMTDGDGKPLTARLYLDCMIATNEKPESLVMFDNYEGNIYPIKGFVQFANVNDCGVIGEWGDKVPVPEWREMYYSKYRGVGIMEFPENTNKYIHLREGEPVFATATASQLYLGYADGAVEPSLSESFVGTSFNEQWISYCIYYDTGNGKWFMTMAEKADLSDYDFHQTKNNQILVPIKKPSGNLVGTTSIEDIIVEAKEYVGDLSSAGFDGAGNFTSDIPSSTKYLFSFETSGMSVELKDNAALKKIRLKYGAAPEFSADWIAGQPKITNIIITGVVRRHLNMTLRIPFDTSAETPTLWKHMGLDTWLRQSGYTLDYTEWKYDNDLELVSIGTSDTVDGQALLGVPVGDITASDQLRDVRFAVNENNKTVLISQKFWIDPTTQENIYGATDLGPCSTTDFPDGRPLSLKASPIMTPHYRTVRNVEGYNVSEAIKTARGCTAKPAYCGAGKLFFSDGMNLVMSDLTLLDKGQVKGIIGTPRAVVPFADGGCLCFTNRSAFRVSPEGIASEIGDGKPSGKAIALMGAVASVSDDGQVLMYSLTRDAHREVRVQVTALSSNIPDIVFNDDSCLAYADDFLFVSTDNEVWGFCFKPEQNGWMQIDKYDFTVKAMGAFHDRLVVLFNQEPNIVKIYQPVTPAVL